MSALQEAELAIARVEKSLGLTRDVSLALLLAYKWEEDKIINIWCSSYEDICTSLGIIPEFEARCSLCTQHRDCQLLGCCHDLCVECIQEYATSRVLNGELNIRCPIPRCGKIAASSAILFHLTVAENVIYEQNLANHFTTAKTQDKELLHRAVNTLIAKVFGFFGTLEGMAIKLWSNRKTLFVSFLLIICFCNSFCVGDKGTCVRELTFVNLFATAFGVWGNVMKVMVCCMIYKVYRAESPSIWIVLVLSFICGAYLIFKILGGWICFFVHIMRSLIR